MAYIRTSGGKKYEPSFQIVAAAASSNSVTIPANSGKKFLIVIGRGDVINIQSASNMTYANASDFSSPVRKAVTCEVTDPTAAASLTLAGSYAEFTVLNID